MDVAEFDFDLPSTLIAQEPPAERGRSRLLVLRRADRAIRHAAFSRIADYLRQGDLLVVNNTRVFPARLLGRRVPRGGGVECLLLGTSSTDEWNALVHPGQKLKPGARAVFERDDSTLYAEVVARHFHGRRTIRLWTDDGTEVTSAVERIGHVPLPPYIKREDRPLDSERYQTVYARPAGSVAAPTAGLHFTTDVLDDLTARGVERTEVTLHVGYGTFKPVRVQRAEEHVVEPETFEVTRAAAADITHARREGRRVIAVGTTTVRTLESLRLTDGGEVEPATGEASLFILPGHRFRLVDGLLTNFHLPRSSLLMLVAAFGGREAVLGAYREAVARGYRFYSYGDAMLVI